MTLKDMTRYLQSVEQLFFVPEADEELIASIHSQIAAAQASREMVPMLLTVLLAREFGRREALKELNDVK